MFPIFVNNWLVNIVQFPNKNLKQFKKNVYMYVGKYCVSIIRKILNVIENVYRLHGNANISLDDPPCGRREVS